MGAHILQARNVRPHLPLEFVLDPHGRELGVEVGDLGRAQLPQSAGRMHGEPGHDPRGYLGPDAVEPLKAFLYFLHLV